MSTKKKFLALLPLVVLGAACNGVSPAAPDNLMSSDEATASAPTAAAESKSAETTSCHDITGVTLEVVPSSSLATVIQATYVRLGGGSSLCAAPVWSSNPRGLLTPQLNGFRVGVASNREVVVTAQAPNGVIGRITLQARTADAAASSAACSNVTGVQLSVLASSTRQGIVVEAKYLGFGPSFGNCAAPAWSSNPRGALTPEINAFRVGVASNRGVVVTATAPNGVRGQLRVQP